MLTITSPRLKFTTSLDFSEFIPTENTIYINLKVSFTIPKQFLSLSYDQFLYIYIYVYIIIVT